MGWFEIYRLFLYVVILVCPGLFFYSLKIAKRPLAFIYGLLCLANAVCPAGTAMQFAALTPEKVAFARKIKYFGIGPVLFLNFLFACKVRFRRRVEPRLAVAVSLIAVLIVVLVCTNGYHGTMSLKRWPPHAWRKLRRREWQGVAEARSF